MGVTTRPELTTAVGASSQEGDWTGTGVHDAPNHSIHHLVILYVQGR